MAWKLTQSGGASTPDKNATGNAINTECSTQTGGENSHGYQTRSPMHRSVVSLHILLESHFIDRLCGLVVRVPVYRTEVYCSSCEVRTEFIYVM
jgi:hypothetical protein